jgi:hypothetical protein
MVRREKAKRLSPKKAEADYKEPREMSSLSTDRYVALADKALAMWNRKRKKARRT